MKLKQFYRYVFVFLVSVFVFTGCGNDNGGGAFSDGSNGNSSTPTNPTTYKKSISIKSTTSKIIAYELEIHCKDKLPKSSDIQVNINKIGINGRNASLLGMNIDESRNSIKVAVVSSGTQDGINLIDKAIEFNGCTDASVFNAIIVDSSANQIDNPEITISE